VFLPERQRIWLYAQPTDMRKSFNGLIAIVVQGLKENPANSDLFVFINRRKTHMKVLYFDGTGYCIWLKRLEQGQFNFRSNGNDKSLLDWTQLRLLLAGIEVKKYRQYKRYTKSLAA
jgi:transposase